MRSALAHVRCPEHGQRCGGRACCCREWHWRPLARRRHMREFERAEGLRLRERAAREAAQPKPELPLRAAIREARSIDPVAFINAFNAGRAAAPSVDENTEGESHAG